MVKNPTRPIFDDGWEARYDRRQIENVNKSSIVRHSPPQTEFNLQKKCIGLFVWIHECLRAQRKIIAQGVWGLKKNIMHGHICRKGMGTKVMMKMVPRAIPPLYAGFRTYSRSEYMTGLRIGLGMRSAHCLCPYYWPRHPSYASTWKLGHIGRMTESRHTCHTFI